VQFADRSSAEARGEEELPDARWRHTIQSEAPPVVGHAPGSPVVPLEVHEDGLLYVLNREFRVDPLFTNPTSFDLLSGDLIVCRAGAFEVARLRVEQFVALVILGLHFRPQLTIRVDLNVVPDHVQAN